MKPDLDRAYAPVGEGVELGGRGSSNERLTSITLRRGEVAVDTHDQPHRHPLSALHEIVWRALMVDDPSFPLELRIERSTIEIPVDGERRAFELYVLSDRAAAVSEGIEITGPFNDLQALELRTSKARSCAACSLRPRERRREAA